MTTARNRTAVRWRATGTFAGPGSFQGFTPNGARIAVEGCDVVTVSDDLITHNDAYLDGADLARQLGVLPPAGSKSDERLTRLANLRTKMRNRVHGAEPERIADGVWIVRGGFPVKTMNVYLIEDEGGLTMFDGGISDMTDAVRMAGARLGGIKRVVLGHVDCDHRGSAPAIDAPIYCHPAERRGGGVGLRVPRLLGPRQARPARPAHLPEAARRPGTAAPSRSPGRSRRATRSRGSGSSSCPGTRPG